MKNGNGIENKNENENEEREFGVGETQVETPFMASEVRKFVKESEDEGLHSR